MKTVEDVVVAARLELRTLAAHAFVVHLGSEHRWGLGPAAFETGFSRSGRIRPRTNSSIRAGTSVMDSSAAPAIANVLV